MAKYVKIGNHKVGEDPTYIVAEIGINHNGDIELAKKLIKIAKEKGCNAVKFQKRNPEQCVPMNKREQIRTTPWGDMTYFDYKLKIEFGEEEYREIDEYCKDLNIDWFVSVWDLDSIDFIKKFNPIALKIPSDKLNDDELLRKAVATKIPLILSTGGSDIDMIDHALTVVDHENTILLQCTSIYPVATHQVNLRVIDTFKKKYNLPIGFSSHHTSPNISLMAVCRGACLVEQHITQDRAMWGTDQAMSLEPRGLDIMVRNIRMYEEALGDGEKKVFDREAQTLTRTIGREDIK